MTIFKDKRPLIGDATFRESFRRADERSEYAPPQYDVFKFGVVENSFGAPSFETAPSFGGGSTLPENLWDAVE